jgi:hypothetical protein
LKTSHYFRESYKFNHAVEELRVVSASITETKEILIALTIPVYIIAICYAITLCLKIMRRRHRVPKNDIESQYATPVSLNSFFLSKFKFLLNNLNGIITFLVEQRMEKGGLREGTIPK